MRGLPERLASGAMLEAFPMEGPSDPGAYHAAVTHLFGTCRMGTDPGASVVGTDFQHHHVRQLFVADSSVFPSNTGVNPQVSIAVLATLCGRAVVSGGAKAGRMPALREFR